ncbi:MAG: UdgX family uracil-DNA binding protein [Marmoricola sp.]
MTASEDGGADHDSSTGAEPWIPDRLSLGSIGAALQECHGCDLWQDATQAVMGSGPRSADLMLVGEAPGDREDQEGRPFIGPAGKLLDEALVDAGIDPQSVYRTNAVKHFRFSGFRGKRRIHQSPDRRHVLACQPWLEAEVRTIQPSGVVLLGATAGQAVLGPRFKVSLERGKVLDWPGQETKQPRSWLVATVHPSAVLRSRHRHHDLSLLVEDLKVARMKCE